MKKIIIVDSNAINYDFLKALCHTWHKHGHAESFPQTEEQFNYLRQYLTTAVDDEHPPIGQKDIELNIRKMITDFCGDTKDEDILCICHADVSRLHNGISGLSFYKKFFDGQQAFVITSRTTDGNALEQIITFITDIKNRSYIGMNIKVIDFQKKMEEEIRKFMLNK